VLLLLRLAHLLVVELQPQLLADVFQRCLRIAVVIKQRLPPFDHLARRGFLETLLPLTHHLVELLALPAVLVMQRVVVVKILGPRDQLRQRLPAVRRQREILDEPDLLLGGRGGKHGNGGGKTAHRPPDGWVHGFHDSKRGGD